MCVGNWQLSLPLTVKRGEPIQFSHSCFPRGCHMAPPGEARFREMADYVKALLAEAHVVMVNGLFTVVVLGGTFSQGQKINGIGQLASEFGRGTCSNLRFTFGQLRRQDRPDQTWFPALPYTCV